MNPLVRKIISLPSIRRFRFILKKAKISESEQSVTIIVEETIKHKDKLQKQSKPVSLGQIFRQVRRCLRLRYYHYPIQYALGIWYFRNLAISIQPPLLIPRFQTEYFVSLMVDKIKQSFPKGFSLRIVDFCCGCGVIGLSILKQLSQEYQLSCVFVDINPKAIKYTRINAIKNHVDLDKVTLIEGDLLQYLSLISQCDIVLSNPPYISTKDYRRLEHQVKLYQDRKALQCGTEGLDLIKPIIDHYLKQTKKPLLGLQYGGQSVQAWGLQKYVELDQYGRRRYLIV